MAKVYTVWVGGTEVNENYLSKNKAFDLLKKYEDDGYDDVQIEKVFEAEIKVALNEADGIEGTTALIKNSVKLLSIMENKIFEGELIFSGYNKKENRLASKIVGIALNTLFSIYTEEKVLAFLKTRRHWANHYRKEHNSIVETIILLRQIIANAATMDDKGMSVKPLLKLLSVKEC